MKNTYSRTWFELFLQTTQPAQTQTEVEFITRHLPKSNYKTVLDLCCGQGRHTRLLAEKGYMSGNRLTIQLDYGPGHEPDIFDWQLFTPDEICELAGEFGLVPLSIYTSFDEKTRATASSPRMQIVFEKD